MENRTPLIILTGPTAVGKTELSVRLAEQINGEIISADSIQIYRHMDIGSAKVTLEEMQGIRHYLIDELEPDEEFNIYIFQEKAKAAIKEIYQAGKYRLLQEEPDFISSPFCMISSLRKKRMTWHTAGNWSQSQPGTGQRYFIKCLLQWMNSPPGTFMPIM